MSNPQLDAVLSAVRAEVGTAVDKFPPFNSWHEAYAVLLEEVDELWDEVRVNQKRRDPDKARKEAIQVAAMAVRFVLDSGDGSK